jgi:DNA-binding response OmpR family regulator
MESMPLVLIVDDDDGVREVVEMMLSEEGFEVVSAANASVASDTLKHFKVDLALVDCVLPRTSGRALAEELGLMGVPVILMSGNRAVIEQQVVSKQAHFLPKPFGSVDLLAMIDLVRTPKG